MVTIYTSNSCASCKKAVKWLEENKIKFKEINISTTPISREDIVFMLKNTDNGFEDIISTRSKAFVEYDGDIEEMKFSELVNFIIDNPTILKRPIIVDDRRMQVGYNNEKIKSFIPDEIKRQWACKNQHLDCKYKEELKAAFQKIKNEEN